MKNFYSIALSVIASFLLVAVASYAATTISTNINTAGTLTVGSLAQFNGGVQVGSGTAVNSLFYGSCTPTSGAYTSIAATSSASFSCTTSGVGTSDKIVATLLATSTPYLILQSASSTASNVIQFTLYNGSISAKTPGDLTSISFIALH